MLCGDCKGIDLDLNFLPVKQKSKNGMWKLTIILNCYRIVLMLEIAVQFNFVIKSHHVSENLLPAWHKSETSEYGKPHTSMYWIFSRPINTRNMSTNGAKAQTSIFSLLNGPWVTFKIWRLPMVISIKISGTKFYMHIYESLKWDFEWPLMTSTVLPTVLAPHVDDIY